LPCSTGTSVSEGATSDDLVLSTGASPLRMNGNSASLAKSPPARDPKGAVFSNVLLEDNHVPKPDPLDCSMRQDFDDNWISYPVPAQLPRGTSFEHPGNDALRRHRFVITNDTEPKVSQLSVP
jgi:hypothetical protein